VALAVEVRHLRRLVARAGDLLGVDLALELGDLLRSQRARRRERVLELGERARPDERCQPRLLAADIGASWPGVMPQPFASAANRSPTLAFFA
jgi:hypothetical protein